jgi:ammonium transporter, Amt family
MTVEWIRNRKPTSIGLATGAVAGLAAITPAAGYVPSWAALVIGLAAGIVCLGAVQLKSLFRYDDALDVVGVHMVAGLIGVVLIGAFASLAINPAGVASGWPQVGRQSALALVALAYPFVTTWIIVRVTDKVVGLRVSPGEQAEGLDLGEHGEIAYELDASRTDLDLPEPPRSGEFSSPSRP